MGKINRISFKNNLERFVIHDMVNYISDGYYLRFEIIAKHCSEGSSEWALWQMLNGKKVKHERDATNYYYMDKNGMLVSKGEQIIEDESRWLKTSSRSWQIYEEWPKPQYKVGDWVELNVHNNYQGQIKKVFPAGMGYLYGTRIHRTEPTFLITGLSCEFHYDTITSKLSPSEVVIPVNISGTVRHTYNEDGTINDEQFQLLPNGSWDGTEMFISFDALDTQTRELVESLLKSQEEEK